MIFNKGLMNTALEFENEELFFLSVQLIGRNFFNTNILTVIIRRLAKDVICARAGIRDFSNYQQR